jgi:uracil-DNA glycosylase family 4
MKKHSLANCEVCPWQDERRFTYVPPITNGTGELLILGEAPGQAEIEQGEPFVGTSGKLLKAVAKQQGLDLSNATLDNVVACHPNFHPGMQPVKPTTDVIKACKPRVVGSIDENVTKVLLLGKTAHNAFMGGADKISEARKGPAKMVLLPEREHLGNIKVVSTYHPAACLRSADYFPSLVRDIRKINAPIIEWDEPNIYI